MFIITTSKPDPTQLPSDHLSALNLLLQNPLQRHGIRRKLRNPLSQLLNRHRLLVEVEPEERLFVDVRLLWDIEGGGVFGVKLLGDFVGAAVEGFEEGRLGGRR